MPLVAPLAPLLVALPFLAATPPSPPLDACASPGAPPAILTLHPSMSAECASILGDDFNCTSRGVVAQVRLHPSACHVERDAAAAACAALPECVGVVRHAGRVATLKAAPRFSSAFLSAAAASRCARLAARARCRLLRGEAGCTAAAAFEWARAECPMSLRPAIEQRRRVRQACGALRRAGGFARREAARVPPPAAAAARGEAVLATVAVGKPPLVLTAARLGGAALPAWVAGAAPINSTGGGGGEDFRGLVKPRALLAWLEAQRVEEERLLVFIDGFDVDHGGCDDLEARYDAIVKETGAPIVFAAELGCQAQVAWPPGCSGIHEPYAEAKRWQEDVRLRQFTRCNEEGPSMCAPGGAPLRFLNSGGFAGPVGFILWMLRRVLAYPCEVVVQSQLSGSLMPDDQVAFSRFWLDWPKLVTLDYRASLFFSTFRFSRKALSKNPDGTIVASWASKTPLCFIHANGHFATFGLPFSKIPQPRRERNSNHGH
ncbi:hypothetical protein AB1Y20_006394 [Prymnesium parvum]|uniref:Uncharacterized protein n=1 Tax=Prymnesium parvum TaxID=97485 RepID=A0AB34J4E7_PRYPA